jgi:hypothetical protein
VFWRVEEQGFAFENFVPRRTEQTFGRLVRGDQALLVEIEKLDCVRRLLDQQAERSSLARSESSAFRRSAMSRKYAIRPMASPSAVLNGAVMRSMT